MIVARMNGSWRLVPKLEMTIEGRQCTAGLACLEGQERPLHKFTEANLSDNKCLGCCRYQDHRIFAKESYRHGINMDWERQWHYKKKTWRVGLRQPVGVQIDDYCIMRFRCPTWWWYLVFPILYFSVSLFRFFVAKLPVLFFLENAYSVPLYVGGM